MNLIFAVLVIIGMYLLALQINKLTEKIDEHDDILNSDE